MLNASPKQPLFLPDFCSREASFAVLLMMQMVALLLASGRDGDGQFWERLLLLSLYLHWIGLCSAAVLCLAQRWMTRLQATATVVISYLLLLAVTAVISEAAWQIAQWQDLGDVLRDREHGVFMLRSLAICAIVSALALRYFWLQAQWRGKVQAESQARYQALQARIRPHFLFNSLNSIAALISSRPREAETAVEDLAQLFRAGLSASDRSIPLHNELEVTRAYLRTESLRLGERLQVQWVLEPGLEQVPVPMLCLQPLLENAVIHGVEPLPQGGAIKVCIKAEGPPTARQLRIEVENPTPAQHLASAGSQTALDNIRQRLLLMYGEAAKLRVSQDAGRFRAHLLLPISNGAS